MQSGPGLGALIAWACVACAACAREAEPAANVLLISLDSVRADFLGAYGAALPHAPGRSPTPSLDRLAAEGVVYTRARSTTSWTLPAHVSLFTGATELVHGVEQDGTRIPDELETLAETLGAAGYRTHGVYSGPYLDARHGFARGFERYEAAYGPELTSAAAELEVSARLVESIDVEREPERGRVAVERRAVAVGLLEDASHRDVSSERVTERVLEALAADDGRPFFLFAHYFDPHYDYVPPAPFDRAFDPGYAGGVDARHYLRNAAIAVPDRARATGRRRVASDRDLEHLQALYAGEIAWTDAQVGRVLDELERRGLAERTLVVVIGDHGDEFFEHDSIGHRQTLHEEVLRVPVLLRLPGRLPAGERRDGELVLADLRREILALLGLDALAERPGPAPIGRLVLPEVLPLAFELDGERREVEGTRVRLLECFWSGPLKLLRARELWRAGEPLEGRAAEAFERAARAAFEREELRWIDLAAHPDEGAAAWSSDFSDARAREALRLFRASHAALVARRAAPPLAAESAELVAALRGLGYVGQEAPQGTLPSETLLLPPPGEGAVDAGGR